MKGLVWIHACMWCCIWSCCGWAVSINNYQDRLDCSSDERANIYAAYFRHHGVFSVVIVVCSEDIASWQQQRDLISIVRHLGTCGLFVRIFNAKYYAVEYNNQENPDHSDQIFKLPELLHKSGIMVTQLSSHCAFNLLAWSADNRNLYFRTCRFWLLLAKNDADITILEDERIYLPPESEVRVMLKSPTGPTEYELIDVYKITALMPLKRRIVGTRLQNASAVLIAVQQFGSAISYRDNLEGITLNTGMVIAFPDVFTWIDDVRTRHIDTITKSSYRITGDVANKLNFRTSNYQTDNYGWLQANKTFDGLMGRLQRNEVDFSRSAILMRLERLGVVDFLADTFRVRAALMFRQPPLSSVANIFALPFGLDVWISILLMMFVTLIALSIQIAYSPHLKDMSFCDCAMFMWGALCQQGFYKTLWNYSTRITVLTTFVATLFLFTSFSANIVALLQTPSQAIHSLNDLNQSPLDVAMQDTPYNKVYFNESTDPLTSRLYRKKIAPKGDSGIIRPENGMEKIRTSLFAYQVELQAGYKIISDTFSETEKCGLKNIEPFQLPNIAIPTRKNFPYRELFRRQLRWQREIGLYRREELKWFPQKPKCEGGASSFVSIGLTECRYAFGIFACGLLLGVFFCGVELLFRHLAKVCQNKKQKHIFPSKTGYDYVVQDVFSGKL